MDRYKKFETSPIVPTGVYERLASVPVSDEAIMNNPVVPIKQDIIIIAR